MSLVGLDPLATLLSEPAFRWLDQPNMALLTDDLRVIHRTEAELRDGLAAFAHLHGWHVTTEFVIPSWGRVDLIAVTAERTYVIEVKKAIIQARHARLAVQQVDGYAKQLERMYAWPRNEYADIDVIVTAAKVAEPMLSEATAAYDVVGFPVGHLLWRFAKYGDKSTAMDRIETTQREARIRRLALAELMKDQEVTS